VEDADAARFFAAPAEWRAWLAANHAQADEAWVGFHRLRTGVPSLTWRESVDQALCFGWIDGVRKGIDARRYRIRFTPRRTGSIWSAVNVRRVGELEALGLMQDAGRAAFAVRRDDRTAIYSHEQRQAATLSADQEAQFRANAAAWAFFEARPPSWRRVAVYWVVSAKREETRARRLAALIDDAANGQSRW